MFDLEIQNIKKGFWFKGIKKITFSLKPSNPTSSIPISLFLKSYITHLQNSLPQNLEAENLTVENFRGRPFESFPVDTAIPEDSKGEETLREEEIFFLAGKIADPIIEDDEEDNQSEDEEPQYLDFTFSLRSNFNEYTPSGEVLHHANPKTTGPIKYTRTLFTPSVFTEWLPSNVDSFRFGIEQYKKKFLGSMAGLVPMINSRFYITVSEKEIFVLAEQIDQKRKNKLPLQAHPSFIGLQQTLGTSLEFDDLIETIQKKVTDR